MPAVIPIIVGVVGAVGTYEAAKKGADSQQQSASTQANAATNVAQINADASKASTAAQLQAAQQALDFQKQQLAAKQAALAPYMSLGAGAVGQIGKGYGLGTGGGTGGSAPQTQSLASLADVVKPPAASAPPAPVNGPVSVQQAAQQQSSSAYAPVTMISPDGQKHAMIPPDHVGAVQQLGWTVQQ